MRLVITNAKKNNSIELDSSKLKIVADGQCLTLGTDNIIEDDEGDGKSSAPHNSASITTMGVNDILWVNDAWNACTPNPSATRVSDAGLLIYDKNNPTVTNYCAPSNWRVDSGHVLNIDTSQSSFVVSMTVDFSNAKGTDGPINCNLYMTGNYNLDNPTVKYTDASKGTNSEFDFFETGGIDGPGELPKLFRVTTHGHPNDYDGTYKIIGFVDNDQDVDFPTTASAKYPMTLEYTFDPENTTLRITQDETTTDITLTLDIKLRNTFDDFKYIILSAGVENDFVPENLTGDNFGYWVLKELSLPATRTHVTMAWSADTAGELQYIQGDPPH